MEQEFLKLHQQEKEKISLLDLMVKLMKKKYLQRNQIEIKLLMENGEIERTKEEEEVLILKINTFKK